jgi:hypothetical protein
MQMKEDRPPKLMVQLVPGRKGEQKTVKEQWKEGILQATSTRGPEPDVVQSWKSARRQEPV